MTKHTAPALSSGYIGEADLYYETTPACVHNADQPYTVPHIAPASLYKL